ncbi:unnamed protein product [Mycetohabitans rhizoxinica HKI 454]|uniref:Uncharacterized protein n=1 Tax=Mycetohabitans rhizoxinica (strain DSM 19002 / CIP 109453 / HKI 454) TaxID=882378 RepID=E5ARB8_MYCRK|nr:unnamed protein product [Mycetohabitans rhizoxinica HKI 454]
MSGRIDRDASLMRHASACRLGAQATFHEGLAWRVGSA